jgi:hypothetical protein
VNYILPVQCGAVDMASFRFQINKIKYFIKKYYSSIYIKNNNNKEKEKEKENLGFYLAGLIEGDGYISITNQNSIILGITFNIKDQTLAEKLLKILGKGSIIKRKTNSIELRFSEKNSLKRIINIINGKFRTPKIDQLHKGIDFLNKKYFMNITKLPLNLSPLNLNSWLAGFIDADGYFYIRYSSKQIACNFQFRTKNYIP